MAVSIMDDISSNSRIMTLKIDRELSLDETLSVVRKAIDQLTKDHAERWLEKHQSEVDKLLDPLTIARLAEVQIAKQLLLAKQTKD